MYSKMFELINDEINNIFENTYTTENKFEFESTLELKKIEIKGIRVKFVFLDKSIMKVRTMSYQLDWFSLEPKLKFIRDYLKPYTDKYFR